MLDPETKCVVTLEAREWNAVLGVLTEAAVPWRISNPLIEAIRSQCMASEARAEVASPPVIDQQIHEQRQP
jgi:hypothetical protein